MCAKENGLLTLDYFYKNRVKVYQKKNGYRFSVDSPILADFIPTLHGKSIEIGTGSGIISFLILFRKKADYINSVELQPQLCDMAKKSAVLNGFKDTFNVVTGDFNKIYHQFKGTDNIFANPPYLKTDRGRLSSNEEIRTAKFETHLKLKNLIEKSSEILAPGGNIFLIYPYDRYEELINVSDQAKLFRVKMRKIFSFINGKPERFLIQLTNRQCNFEESDPLIIYKSPGTYSKEMDSVLSGIKYD